MKVKDQSFHSEGFPEKDPGFPRSLVSTIDVPPSKRPGRELRSSSSSCTRASISRNFLESSSMSVLAPSLVVATESVNCCVAPSRATSRASRVCTRLTTSAKAWASGVVM